MSANNAEYRITGDFQREMLPHMSDARINEGKTKVGHEIPLNRHFYRCEPSRPPEAIEADSKTLE